MSKLSNIRAKAAASAIQPAPPGFSGESVIRPLQTNAFRLPDGFDDGGIEARLPAQSAIKLQALREARDDLFAVTGDLHDKLQELFREKADAAARYRQLTQPSFGGRVSDDHPSAIMAKAKVDRLDSQIAALNERMATRSARGNQIGGLVSELDRYLKGLPTSLPLAVQETPALKLTKGVGLDVAVEQERQSLATLQADLHTLRSRPHKSSVVKSRIKSIITQMAAAGEPDVSQMVDFGGDLIFPKRQVTGRVIGYAASDAGPLQLVATAHFEIDDVFAMTMHQRRDAIIKDLCAAVDLVADNSQALSDDERANAEQVLFSKMLAVQRREEALITAAEERGVEILRRREADPRAVLLLPDSLPAPREI